MAVDPAIIAASIQATSQGINMFSQGRMNRKTRIWNENMHNVQRDEANADFDKVNQYNSPRAQMQRYRDAGLNPNLIYGNMTEASPERSTDTNSWNPQAPQMDTSGAMAYYDIKKKSAETDILNKVYSQRMQDEHDTALANILKIQSETNNNNLTGDQLTLANDLAARLNPIKVQQAGADLIKTGAETGKITADTAYTIHEDIRKEAMQTGNLTEQQIRIKRDLLGLLTIKLEQGKIRADTAKAKKEVEILGYEATIKKLDADLAKRGIKPSDPAYQRWISEAYDKITGSAVDAYNVIKDNKKVSKDNWQPPKFDTKKFNATDSQ